MAGLEFMRFRVHPLRPHHWSFFSFSSQVWIRRIHPELIFSIQTSPSCNALSGNPNIMSSSWACSRCTYLNESGSLCHICQHQRENAALEDLSRKRKVDEVSDEEDGSSRKRLADDEAKREARPKVNDLLLELHRERVARQKLKASQVPSAAVVASSSKVEETLTFLTYNVWFQEEIQVEKRMAAIRDLVKQHQPHLICLQEVTPNIYSLLRDSSWWSGYRCSVEPGMSAMRSYFCVQLSRLPVDRFSQRPFKNTIMGRELCEAHVNAGNNVQLVVATTHLESPCRWDQLYSPERVAQAKESFEILSKAPNVIFGGDFNWDDKADGKPPHGEGWSDAWVKLRPNEPGLTYDTKMNPMISANSRLQKRLDRIFCRLQDFELQSIEMIGTKALPGVTYRKEKTVQKQKQVLTLPVLPSDHFGLVLKICKKPACFR